MSLVKKPTMTEKRRAALRENGKHSRGVTTPEGRKRIRDANLRHGFYSKSDEVALRALGEDPAEFEKLLEGLRGKQTALSALQERLATRLARALWRMDRADRMQDGYALRQAKTEGYAREGRLHMQMMRLKMVSGNWEKLAQSVARGHYVTTPADLELMRELHKEGVVKEMSEVALALFYELREPGMLKPGDEGFEDEEAAAKRRRVMNQIRGIFALPPLRGTEEEEAAEPNVAPDFSPALGDPQVDATEPNVAPDFSPAHADLKVGATQPEADEADPHSEITEEQWTAREPVRQLLENLLTRQVEIFDAQHHELLRESVAGPSPYERAAEIVPTHPDSKFMQRMEDSNCRQVLRMSSLLLRLKRHERQSEQLGDPIFSRDVIENKGS